MATIRTFVAVLISDDLKRSISRLQDEVRNLAPDVRWVPPENLHITLKFLGNIDESALSQVSAAVEDAARRNAPFDLSVSGLGAFPTLQKARVVWVGINQGSERLTALASAIENRLVEVGFSKEDKEFKSHITIGRAKNRFARGLANAAERVNACNLGKQNVSSIAVMGSELHPGGAVYTVLKSVELGA